MDTHSLSQALTLRSFWLRIGNKDLTRQQSRELAAQQLADEHREASHAQQRLDRASHPVGQQLPQHADPVVRAFIRKVSAVAERLWAAPKPPLRRIPLHDRTAAPAVQQPPPPEPPKPLIDRIADAILPEPEPAPEPPPRPTIQSPGSSAQLIVDNPHNAGIGDVVTDNWRRSIQENVVNFNERRGTPSSGRYIG
jgi:hypothetical protein